MKNHVKGSLNVVEKCLMRWKQQAELIDSFMENARNFKMGREEW